MASYAPYFGGAIMARTEKKTVTPEEFINEAKAAAQTLVGFASADLSKPNVVLFGVSASDCPTH
jgi:hypothetical protein